MRAIPFAVLMKAYPRKRDIDHDALFRLLGWDDLIKNPTYANTCAIRVSLALLRSGVHIPGGRLQVKIGAHKGTMIEPGQARLSMILSRPTMLGATEKLSGGPAIGEGIGQLSGIVSFFRLIPGIYEGGHIDIVSQPAVGLAFFASGITGVDHARMPFHAKDPPWKPKTPTPPCIATTRSSSILPANLATP